MLCSALQRVDFRKNICQLCSIYFKAKYPETSRIGKSGYSNNWLKAKVIYLLLYDNK